MVVQMNEWSKMHTASIALVHSFCTRHKSLKAGHGGLMHARSFSRLDYGSVF